MATKATLLVSGELGHDLLVNLFKYIDIEFVATDKKSLKIIDFARLNNIPIFTGNPRNGMLSSFIGEDFKSELLLSINYLFLIEEDFINKFLYPINFHGSLLPRYRGRTPHVWAIINNEHETGITAHFIDNGCDTGDIVLQKNIAISYDDTGFSILEKYKMAYPEMVKTVIDLYVNNNIKRIKQDDSIATYYGKRVPEDGQIDWGWQKERIRNWVRALAFPYPGAFTFFEDKKIIIDKISYCKNGFSNEIANGTILETNPDLIIKTSNGAIKIETMRVEDVEFVKNKILK